MNGILRPLLLILLCAVINSGLYSQEKKQYKTSGFIDFNGYYDTRSYSVMTINMLARLPRRFQYFSLTNYEGPSHSSELGSFYSEQNIRWAISDNVPLDLTYQYIMRQGARNDDHRFGVRWKASKASKLSGIFEKINMFYSVNPMFIQFRERWQTKYMTLIEHVYKIKLLKEKLGDRIYIGGFADQNFVYNDNRLSFEWVTEHQLGVRLVSQLFAVAEYRINTFLPSDKTGWGFGFEYKIVFK